MFSSSTVLLSCPIDALVLVQVFLHLLVFCLLWLIWRDYLWTGKKVVCRGKKLKWFLLNQFEKQLCLKKLPSVQLYSPCPISNKPALASVCVGLRRRRAAIPARQWGGDLCPSSLTFSRRLLAGALCWLRLVCVFCLPHNVRGRGEDTDVSSAIFTSSCFSISLATKTAFICKNLKAISFWKATLKVSKGDFIHFLSFGWVF